MSEFLHKFLKIVFNDAGNYLAVTQQLLTTCINPLLVVSLPSVFSYYHLELC